jgi:hypothetical protein
VSLLEACHHRLIAWVRAQRVLLVVLLVLSVLVELALIATAPRGTVTASQAARYILPAFLPPLFLLPLWYANWFSAPGRSSLLILRGTLFALVAASVLFVLIMTLVILLRDRGRSSHAAAGGMAQSTDGGGARPRRCGALGYAALAAA